MGPDPAERRATLDSQAPPQEQAHAAAADQEEAPRLREESRPAEGETGGLGERLGEGASESDALQAEVDTPASPIALSSGVRATGPPGGDDAGAWGGRRW